MSDHAYPEGTVLGLLADSHGRAGMTRRAVDLLLTQARVDVLVHLGDVGSDTVLDALAGAPAHVVFGNCDDDWPLLAEYASSLGLTVDHPVGRLLIGHRSVVFAHGDNSTHLREAVSSAADYFCHGHSHVFRDETAESTRLVNPGALFRASRYTVVRLEPCTGRLDVFPVEP